MATHVAIPDYQILDDGVVLYRLHMEGIDGEEWSVEHRFSTFTELNNIIIASVPAVARQLPPFPAKSFRTSIVGLNSTAFIEKRRSQLELWLQRALAFEEIRNLTTTKGLLLLPDA